MKDGPKRGDKRLFGTYWSQRGPIAIEISEWVFDGEQYIMPGSPNAQRILAEMSETQTLPGAAYEIDGD